MLGPRAAQVLRCVRIRPDRRSPIAEEALKRIGELYKIEAEITGQPAETRLAVRQNRAVAILDALRDWLTAQRRRLSSKNALAKAIQYALSRWEALTRYAGDGRLAIDNNVAERALRGIAITRKNFLFLGSEAGGERAAILYTVLESAKLNGLDPEGPLADAIDRMTTGHPIVWPNCYRGTGMGSLPNWRHERRR